MSHSAEKYTRGFKTNFEKFQLFICKTHTVSKILDFFANLNQVILYI